MAENTGEIKMTPTLGLTGLTMNAMALIAPGAFLWLTFAPPSDRGCHGALDVDRPPLRAFVVSSDGGAIQDTALKALPQGFWSSFGYVLMTPWRRCPTACSQLRWRPTSGPSCSTC